MEHYDALMTSGAWKTVRRIEDVIAARYREALSLADIATAVGKSRAYVSALYSRARGRTITSYITELRVRHAESLLAWDGLSVLEIAAASGFGSVSRFYEAFVEVTGRRPREVRPGLAPPPPVFTLYALWVDDTPENNISERRALNSMGIAVDNYVSGSQGLKALAHGGYSLVISDVRRPDDKDSRQLDSGWAFARAAKARYPNIPLLFYCGYDDPARRQQAREVGAAGIFTHQSQLLDAVGSALYEDLASRKSAGTRARSTGGTRRRHDA